MVEIQKLVPNNSRLLGVINNSSYRPSIAPHSIPIAGKDRVLYEQGGQTIDFATSMRAPICLLSEGDTELLRNIGNPEEGLTALEGIIANSPTAAVLFDAYRRIDSNPTLVWFAEDDFFAKTVSRAINVDTGKLLPLFQLQADETVRLLSKIAGTNRMEAHVKKNAFSDKQVMDAISEAINLESLKLGYLSKDRRKLGESSAAIVGITHALFPLINSLLLNKNELAAVQGPIHLETIPPHWLSNPALSTVTKFVSESAADWNLNHRSLLPCLYKGEPIGEYSVISDESPQLGRTQRWKLEKWVKQSPFPLAENPIFGHALGLLENKSIADGVSHLIDAEMAHDKEQEQFFHALLGRTIDLILTNITFWHI